MTRSTTRRKHGTGASPWAALAGVDAARDRLIASIVGPVRRAHAFARLGIRPAIGHLLYGPPGVGKSLLVRAAAADAGARLLAMSAPDLLARAAGEGEKLVREAFSAARMAGPAVIFFDELDLLAPMRAAGEAPRNDRLLFTLLAEMDRLAGVAGVFVVGSTSRPNAVDPALLRPGRLDELVYVAVPDQAGREGILARLAGKMAVARNVHFAAIAERTDRFTAADLDDVVRRAGLAALARKADSRNITMADFETALADTRASVTEAMERDYEKVQGEIKQNALKLEPMGFFGPGQLKPVRDSKHGATERS